MGQAMGIYKQLIGNGSSGGSDSGLRQITDSGMSQDENKDESGDATQGSIEAFTRRDFDAAPREPVFSLQSQKKED